MPRAPTKWQIAKPLLERDYLDGTVTDSMKRMQVWKSRPEYEACNINSFGTNFLLIKKKAKEMKRRAVIDAAALCYDRFLYPITSENRWDGSAAQRFLKQDIELGFYEYFTPMDLWLSREEYQEYDINIFRPHVHQEIRSKLETNYWLSKKAKKLKKSLLADDADNTDFFDDCGVWS